MVKNLPAMQETQVRSLDWEDPPEKGIASHSNILAWKIPLTEETGSEYSSLGCIVGPCCLQVKAKVAQLFPTLWDPMDYTVREISRPEYWNG